MASAWTWILCMLAILAAMAVLTCLVLCSLCSRHTRRRRRRRRPPAPFSDYQPDQTGHLYSHVIFADRTYQARMGERHSRIANQAAQTELAAPHVSQLHPAYLPPAYSEIVGDRGGSGGHPDDDDQPPPNYAAAVAAAANV
ncbi:hypothetical protein BOX15_Mlig026226g4 [Macrostomum lignano]|uniref:Uncharacterized protein n=1 Tax=Macrostomum lignano TaxID=282301 RepID=A0A267FVB9_9PLAT|nr:hypothetical protein BOX15_Mlig026226g2 [Macrostomum lignano]PAA76949.1 hypothetical protein BOX15_Mlig026226g4 [Macrostomum lignano]